MSAQKPNELDGKIDDALAAWPEVETYDEATVAEKTTKRIRANFPPKTRNVLSDDALLAAPFPAEPDEGALPVEPREVPEPAHSYERATHEKVTGAKISAPNDVPSRRPSSIPPPSSRVARSETTPAPSVREENKPEASMGQVERQRDRMSFKDLAKLAQTPPPSSVAPQSARVSIPSAAPSRDSDSGVVDLQAAALSDPGAVERSKSTPLASGSLFDDDAPHSGRVSDLPPPSMTGEYASGPVSAVGPVSQQLATPYGPASVRPSAPPNVAPQSMRPSAVAAVAAQPAAAQTDQRRSPILAILGGLVVVGSLAAGAVLYVKAHKTPAPVAQNVDVQAPVIAPSLGQASTAAATQAVAPPDDAVALNSLPTDDSTPTTAKMAAKPAAHTSKPSSGGSKAASGALTKEEAPPVPDQKAAPVAKDETPLPAAETSGSLQNAMQTAAGPSESTTKQDPSGPKFAAGTVPQRPSQGALASAIGRVLPGARSCLGPDDGVSYATVLFESSGGVQNVSLSGFAANKPSASCITTALKKASVGPFAEPTYSAKITVRP